MGEALGIANPRSALKHLFDRGQIARDADGRYRPAEHPATLQAIEARRRPCRAAWPADVRPDFGVRQPRRPVKGGEAAAFRPAGCYEHRKVLSV
jgi:hypothetical protein